MKDEKPLREESKWRRRARTLLFWAIVLELVGLALFIAVLFIGERSRMTLIALYLPRLPLLLGTGVAALLVPLTRRRVRSLLAIQIAAFLLVLFPIMGLHVASGGSAKPPIRLVTYNVFWGHGHEGNTAKNRAKLIDDIAAMEADIFVSQASFGSMNEMLRARFPDRTIRQDGEFVLMTRFPVRDTFVPPPLPDGTDIMFVKYIVTTPAGDVRIVNVHPFSPRHALFADEETAANILHREQQIESAVLAARNDVPPFIVVGDTNLPPLSSIARRNFTGLKDAFEETGFGFGYTFPANHPWMRIDRALGSDGIRFVDVRVAPRGTSDHRALAVDFELTGN